MLHRATCLVIPRNFVVSTLAQFKHRIKANKRMIQPPTPIASDICWLFRLWGCQIKDGKLIFTGSTRGSDCRSHLLPQRQRAVAKVVVVAIQSLMKPIQQARMNEWMWEISNKATVAKEVHQGQCTFFTFFRKRWVCLSHGHSEKVEFGARRQFGGFCPCP
jgi:hypothetical protein